MPLGTINFQNIPTFEPVEGGVYPGQTDSWEAKPTKNGDSMNVEGKFKFTHDNSEGEEQERSIILRWNLKREALWRIRGDLVKMGVDPSDLNSSAVDLEATLNEVFGSVPTLVNLTIRKYTYTPENGGDPQERNEVTAVSLRR